MAQAHDARGAPAAERDNQREKQDGAEPGQSVAAELLGIVREEASKALKPAARQVARAAVKYLVKHGPDLINDKLKPALGNAGETGGARQRRRQRREDSRQRREDSRQRRTQARKGGSRGRAESSAGRSSTAASRRTGGQSRRQRSGQRTR